MEFEDGLGYEDEEYHCAKCGKHFYQRIKDSGDIDFDEGAGRCGICNKCFCEECGQWHTYGGKYKRICKTCFDGEILDSFSKWYDIFKDEYCDIQCDDCPFFFKKGCMMILLQELVDMAFHTKELKEVELRRLQDKNRRAEEEWERHLHEATERNKKV
jgi:hypothetical protein